MDPRIEQVFREVLEDDDLEVVEGLSSTDTPAWDSFAQVKLVIALEEEFGVKFTLDEVTHIRTVGDVIESLAGHGAALD